MNRRLRVLISGLVAGLCLAPQSLAAQELTPDQVTAAFSRAGFDVEAPTRWTWISPPHTTLRVHDRAAGRVVLVLVYSDTATATAEQFKAHARLVPGYGPSAWHENVALVQASQPELDRWFATESARSIGMSAMPSEGQSASEPVSASVVASDFLAVLVAPLVVDL
jgi:hypothetical protein